MKGKVEKVEKEGKRRGKGRGEGKRGREEENEEGREEENEEGREMKKVHRGFLCSRKYFLP